MTTLKTLSLLPLSLFVWVACGDSNQTSATTTVSASSSAASTGATGGGGSGQGGQGGQGGAGGGEVLLTQLVSTPEASFSFESEPAIIVSVDGVVAVAWIASLKAGGSTIGYAMSLDHGITWSKPQVVMTDKGRFAFDPSFATDKAGNIFLAWADTQGGANGRTLVARAAKGSTLFEAPVVVKQTDDTAFFDRPSIAVTPKGQIVVAYAREIVKMGVPPDSTLLVATSPDGATWTESTALDTAQFVDFARPCIPSDGGDRVYLSFLGGQGVSLLWSDDGGATWPVANAALGLSGADGVGTQPCCAALGKDVWISYGATNESFTSMEGVTLSAAKVRHSSDSGETFAPATSFKDPAGARLEVPELGLSDTGRLGLAYYVGKAKEDPAASFRFSTSLDKGATWATSTVALDPVLMTVKRASKAWLGDYEGIALAEGRAFLAFADNTDASVSHIRFYRSKVLMP